jgi:hypothetical protein
VIAEAGLIEPRRGSLHPAGIVLLFLCCLLPFAWKPFHIDDPMYVWAAQQIVAHPWDFYGFTVNWHGTATPMATVMKNPPLVSYYLAAVGVVAGWSEVALHLALFVPSVGVVLGTYSLARRFTSRPDEAALVAAFSPAFFVSSTTVMSDVLMLCAWVWSLIFWVKGIRERASLFLALGALGAAITALTKYFGIGLLPLLVLYGILRGGKPWRWAPWLLLPVALLAAYQVGTEQMYGRGLLLDASAYASAIRSRTQPDLLPRLIVGLAFTGGCFATALWYCPALWSRRATVGWVLAFLAMALLLASLAPGGVHLLRDASGVRWGLVAQVAASAVVGAAVVTLTVLDLVHDRSPESALLSAWVAGTMFFAFRLNWGVSARALLPMTPAFAILLARRLDRRDATNARPFRWDTRWALLPAAALSILVARADQQQASSAREAATRVAATLEHQSRAVWFQGHWGFQYYGQLLGLLPLDFRHPSVHVGDLIVKPDGITNPIELPEGTVELVGDLAMDVPDLIGTMSLARGAGFYSDVWGPLPFAFGRAPPEHYRVYRAVVPLLEP